MSAPIDPRTAWLAARRAGIGGSDVAAVLGVSPWATPLDVYLSKVDPAPDADSPAKRRGRRLEPVVIEIYAEETGRRVERVPEIVRGPEPWMLASLDGISHAPARVLEIKTASPFVRGWGESGGDGLPDHYAAQVLWYLAVTGLPAAEVAVLIGSDDFRVYPVARDEELIDHMVARVREFWHRHVLAGVPPPPVTAADCARLWPAGDGQAIEADDATRAAILELAEVRAEARALEARAAGLDARLRAAIGPAEALTAGGLPLATLKTQTANAFDQTAFRAEHPALFAQYTRPRVSRVLRLKR